MHVVPKTIILLGNVNNNFYLLSDILCKNSDFKVFCFIEKDKFMENPGHETGIFSSRNMEGIRFLKKYEILLVRYFPRFSRLLSEFDSFATVICSSDFVTLAKYSKQKFVFYPTGFDLTRAPFLFDNMIRPGFLSRNRIRCLPKVPLAYVFQHNVRKGLEKCSQHLSHIFAPYELAYRKLENLFPIQRSNVYVPWTITTEHFSPEKFSKFVDLEVRRDIDKVHCNLFMPSRFLTDRTVSNEETGNWKNNQIVIEAFDKLVSTASNKCEFFLYLIDRNNYRKNFDDIGLYDREKITPYIRWLKPTDTKGFTRLEMMKIYKEMDFVLDDFGVGWFGGISLEALAMGCLVVNNVPTNLMVALYGSNPFLFAENSDQIFGIIEELSHSRDQIEERKKRNIGWMKEHHSAEKIVQAIEKLV
jgi:glycosyltransferase involved in cell wall biosynthesis